LEQEHAADIAYIERKSQGFWRFLAVLDSRYRAIRRRWLAYRLPAFRASLLDQAREMQQVDRLCAERTALNGMEKRGQELFGGLWQGERSSWDVLENYVHWVVEFRSLCVRHGLAGRAVEIATQAAPDVSDVEALKEAAAGVLVVLGKLYAAVGWPEDYLTKATLTEIIGRLQAIAQNIARGPQWAAFEAVRQTVEQGLAGALLPAAMSGQIAFQDLAPAFLRTFPRNVPRSGDKPAPRRLGPVLTRRHDSLPGTAGCGALSVSRLRHPLEGDGIPKLLQGFERPLALTVLLLRSLVCISLLFVVGPLP
jgi:hypothetical protein